MPRGRHAPDHPALWYTGWRATGEAADPSQDGHGWVLHALDDMQAIELLLNKLKETKSNFEFLLQVQKTTPDAPMGVEQD